MPDNFTRTHGAARRHRYGGGRSRGGAGFGLVPFVLLLVLAAVAWKLHGGSVPGVHEVRTFIGR